MAEGETPKPKPDGIMDSANKTTYPAELLAVTDPFMETGDDEQARIGLILMKRYRKKGIIPKNIQPPGSRNPKVTENVEEPKEPEDPNRLF